MKGSHVDHPTRLTTEQNWIEAAYTELGEVGPDGVSVESVARSLGVSKAGFYHRFANRKELLDLVVQRWFEHSESVIAGAADVADPIEQIVEVGYRAITDTRLRKADVWLLLRAPTDPDHAEVTRLTRESILTWMSELLTHLDVPHDEARTRATLIYFGYLGITADIETIEPQPDDHTIRSLLEQLIRTLATSSNPATTNAR